MLDIFEIEQIKGVGSKLIDKIIQSYGSYDVFVNSVLEYDIDKLMNIQGLSQKKALEIIRFIHGINEDNFIKTQQAQKIYEDIINKILEFTSTDYARNRVLLLNPTTDYDEIKRTSQLIEKTLDDTANLDYNYIRLLYENIKPLNNDVKPKFNDEYAILCEDYNDYLSLIKRGINKYCNIYPLEDHVSLDDFEFVIYLYNEYNVDPGESANVVSISNDSPDYEIQPNIILEYYRKNRSTLEYVYQLREYLGLESCIDEVLVALDSISLEKKNKKAIIDVVEEIKDEANDTINQQIKEIALEGDEVLQLLNNEGNLPSKIMSIFNEVLDEAKEEITNKTGLIFDPFIIKYPLELDYDEIKRIQENTLANIHLKEYEQEINACVILEKYRKEKKLEQIIKLLRSGILLYGNTYVIMPIGKNELCSNYGRQNENPSVAALGFSIPILGMEGLNP